MPPNRPQASYYLRCGLSELDRRGGSVRQHLGAVYGQWFAEAGSHMPSELEEDWATVRARMTSAEHVGAHGGFEVAAAMMTDTEAVAVVDDIAAIMVRLGLNEGDITS